MRTLEPQGVVGNLRGFAGDSRRSQAASMNGINDDDLFLDAVDAIVLDALAKIGYGPKARSEFFGWLLTVAREVALDAGAKQPNH